MVSLKALQKELQNIKYQEFTSDALFEKVNELKLEKVIESSTPSKKMIQFLKDYKQIPLESKGRIIEYFQTIENGRKHTLRSIQGMKRWIRGVLVSDIYADIDVKNCAPAVFQNLFQMYGIKDKFLEEYVADRDATLKKYKLEDKLALISIINNQTIKTKESAEVKMFHKKLYQELLPRLRISFPLVFNNILKFRTERGRSSNVEVALFYQNVENTILRNIKETAENAGLVVGVQLFDGILVEKSPKINQSFLNLVQKNIRRDIGMNLIVREKVIDDEEPEEPDSQSDENYGNSVDLPVKDKVKRVETIPEIDSGKLGGMTGIIDSPFFSF